MNDARIRYPRPHHGRSIQLAHSWGRAHRFCRTKAPGLPPCTGRNRALWIISRHRKRTWHGSSAYRGPMNAVSCAGMALADKKDQMDGLCHIRLADGISRIFDGAKGVAFAAPLCLIIKTAHSAFHLRCGLLDMISLKRCNIRQMHRVRFNNTRALHDCLRCIKARQTRAAGLHRQAAQFKAVAVFKPAVCGLSLIHI